MKNDIKGMTDLNNYSSNVKVINRRMLKDTKIGQFVITVKQKDSSEKRIVLRNVKYVPKIYCIC